MMSLILQPAGITEGGELAAAAACHSLSTGCSIHASGWSAGPVPAVLHITFQPPACSRAVSERCVSIWVKTL